MMTPLTSPHVQTVSLVSELADRRNFTPLAAQRDAHGPPFLPEERPSLPPPSEAPLAPPTPRESAARGEKVTGEGIGVCLADVCLVGALEDDLSAAG